MFENKSGVVLVDVEVKEVDKINKAELVELVYAYESVLCFLEKARIGRDGKIKKAGRIDQLMDIFNEDRKKLWSVKDLSSRMSAVSGVRISSRNISSLLSYCRAGKWTGGKVDFVRVGGGVGKLRIYSIDGAEIDFQTVST